MSLAHGLDEEEEPPEAWQKALGSVARQMLEENVAKRPTACATEPPTIERMFSDPMYMGIPASPLQIAVTRSADGRDQQGVLSRDELQAHFGRPELAVERPTRVVLICGVRGGKSTLGIAAAITACLTADLSVPRAHEIPRYAIIGPNVNAAEATYKQLVGYIQSSPELARHLDGEPTANRVVLRRDDGRRVDIVVAAAHRGGLSVRNRWLVGITLEEVASFGSEATGAVVNAEDILRAAETRLLPGCQAWLISSPFGPIGLLYDLYKRWFGQPGMTLVVHAPTRALNPSFPQEKVDAIARDDPDTAAREYGAEWVDADSAFLEATMVDAATRKGPLIREGTGFAAAIDPATRGNAWTLAVGWSEQHHESTDLSKPSTPKVTIAGVWQWIGSKKQPLSTRETFRQIAEILRPYNVRDVYSDGWSIDALAEHAMAFGLTLKEHEGDNVTPYVTLRTLLGNGMIELPPDPVMRHDLLAIRKRVTGQGVRVSLPTTADGRHCDYAPAVSLTAHYASLLRPIKFEYTSAGDHRHSWAQNDGWDDDD